MNSEKMKPPVKVPLYQHQQKAFEFVMRIFHADSQPGEHKQGGERNGSGRSHL